MFSQILPFTPATGTGVTLGRVSGGDDWSSGVEDVHVSFFLTMILL